MEEATTQGLLVSVIMPAYNSEKYIAAAIESVIAQSEKSWELIIIDDCSRDNTTEIVKHYLCRDSRIKFLQNDINHGVAFSRNRGLDAAQGKYVAFLDSDDIWHAEKLEKQITEISRSEAQLVYTSYELMDEKGAKGIKTHIVSEEASFDGMLKNNQIGCSTVMIDKAVADRYRFDIGFFHEDYVMWLKMLRDDIKMRGIRESLSDYRVFASSKAGNKKKSAYYRWKVYREFLKYDMVKSAWYFANYAINGVVKYK